MKTRKHFWYFWCFSNIKIEIRMQNNPNFLSFKAFKTSFFFSRRQWSAFKYAGWHGVLSTLSVALTLIFLNIVKKVKMFFVPNRKGNSGHIFSYRFYIVICLEKGQFKMVIMVSNLYIRDYCWMLCITNWTLQIQIKIALLLEYIEEKSSRKWRFRRNFKSNTLQLN